MNLTRPLEILDIAPRETCVEPPPNNGLPTCNPGNPHPEVDPCAIVFRINWDLAGPQNSTIPLNFGLDGPALNIDTPVEIMSFNVVEDNSLNDYINIFAVPHPLGPESGQYINSHFQISLYYGVMAESLYGKNIQLTYKLKDATGDTSICNAIIETERPSNCPTATCASGCN